MSKPTSPFGRVTRKLYYDDYLLKASEAKVVRVEDGRIELDGTVSFPEGGGQEGDRGWITTGEGIKLWFCDTRKRYGRQLFLPDFPVINVDTIIDHVIDEKCRHLLELVASRDTVRVEIDVARRARLTLSHTAAHLVYVATQETRPDATENTRGCHIKEDSARLDFGTSDRFQPDEIETIAAIANDMVRSDAKVRVYPHPDEPEALYWECEGHVLPCGGTHLTHTGPIGPLEVRRRNIGKGVERLILAFPNPTLDLSAYHE